MADVPEFVDVVFDCVPLRMVGQVRPPLDASPAYHARCERLAAALERYGAERAYWLENAHCIFRLANSEIVGMVRFEFDGVALTDPGDAKTDRVELHVRLTAETCGGVPPEVAQWLSNQVHRAVAVEFDRYIASGRLPAAALEPPPDDAGL